MNTLELTDQEINTILFGLQKLPYENVAGLIPKIVKQIQEKEKAIKEEPQIEKR
jgi:hypothetical protein